MDYDVCMKNLETINKNLSQYQSKLLAVMQPGPQKPADPYKSIYIGGFFSKKDQKTRADLHRTQVAEEGTILSIEAAEVHELSRSMDNPTKHHDLILRAKWNSFHEKLMKGAFSPNEFTEWVSHLEQSLCCGIDNKSLTIDAFRDEVEKTVSRKKPGDHKQLILDKLVNYVNRVESRFSELTEMAHRMDARCEAEMIINPSISSINKVKEWEMNREFSQEAESEFWL